MIEGSNDYYRHLIKKGGRNVVVARQVLSTQEAAKQQSALLAALEGTLDMPQAVATTSVPAAPTATPSAEPEPEPMLVEAASNGNAPGRMRFTPEQADVIERWALGEDEQ